MIPQLAVPQPANYRRVPEVLVRGGRPFKGSSVASQLISLSCDRVEDWRANCRLRWVFRRFRSGPQSGCHDHVSSPRRIERSVRVSRTTLTCSLLATAYGTYSTETTLRRSRRNR
jgi:hypothetical protein